MIPNQHPSRNSEDIIHLKDFFLKCPFVTIMLVFLTILTIGGVLKTSFIIFTILAIVQGFNLSIIYGAEIGLAPYQSVIFCLGIYTYLSYSTLCILETFEHYVKAKPYIKKIKTRFTPVYYFLTHNLGRFGFFIILIPFTFFMGWWVAVALAFIADLKIHHAIVGIFLGLTGSGIIALILYAEIQKVVSNPFALAAVFIGISLILGTIMHSMISRIGKVGREIYFSK
jgi:hypothetical protein